MIQTKNLTKYLVQETTLSVNLSFLPCCSYFLSPVSCSIFCWGVTRTSWEIPGEVLLYSICPWNESSVLCAPLLTIKPPSFHLWGNLETRRCSGLLWWRTGTDLVNNTPKGLRSDWHPGLPRTHPVLALKGHVPGDPLILGKTGQLVTQAVCKAVSEINRKLITSQVCKLDQASDLNKTQSKIDTRHRSPMILRLSILVKQKRVSWEWSHMVPQTLFFQPAHEQDMTGKGRNPKATCFLRYKEHSSELAEWEDSKCTQKTEGVQVLIYWFTNLLTYRWPKQSNVSRPEMGFTTLAMQENKNLHTGII